ncbi:MAG: flagellin lysine-N-methylase [Lachnospiraceae bacterium]|nr:flagellin lysine-N-methylase [Lachnospiraceae bacterium]
MIQVLEIYKKFHCLGPDCPQSCCMGWQIPVEKETFQRYADLTGVYGRHVRSNVAGKPDLHYVKKQLGRCPFLNCDRHCQFQDNGETELMPIVCRLYPRESMSFGDLILVTFTLSCPAAARLLIENPGRLSFVETDIPIEVLWVMNNDEPEYRDLLLAERDRMLDYFWDTDDMDSSEVASESCGRVATRFSELRRAHDHERPDFDMAAKWQDMFAHIYTVHDAILSQRQDIVDIPLTSDKSAQGKYALLREPTYAFFPIKTIDRMILEVIDYGSLFIRQHEMYRLIKLYTKRYSKLLVREADKYFDEHIKKLVSIHPEYMLKYRSYFSYNIEQLLPVAYENYHILRQYLFAVLYTELYMIFDLLDYEDHGETPPSIERQSFVMALCEHAIRHNPDLTDNLLRVIRQEFL